MGLPSAEVRAQLDHPVIDCDGHVQEYLPAALPYLRQSLGPAAFDRYLAQGSTLADILGGGSPEERVRHGLPQSAWWATPAGNTRDLATAMLPGLLVERMGELGMDFAVLYPTKAMGAAAPVDPELRQGLCRGWNEFYADAYGPYGRHLTVAGLIPMHTPDEAVAELEHCKAIGLKVVVIPEGVYRPIPEPLGGHASPFLMPGQSHWFDAFGLDSPYDYDPVWAAFEALGFAVTAHGGMGQIAPNGFTSPTNYSFNHIGAIAGKMHHQVKSLFMSGVTCRFPRLPIAALECGVNWATTLLNDLVEHWEKRGPAGLAHLDPGAIDWEELERLAVRHGGGLLVPGRDLGDDLRGIPAVGAPPAEPDEWRRLTVATRDELVEAFAEHFYFGCEADDRTLAFSFHPANAAVLRPVFSSDIGHWDVPDMAATLGEAWELVEEGWLAPEQFRAFVFDNPVRLLTAVAPGFFDGTVVAGGLAGAGRRPPGGPRARAQDGRAG
jgi:predicted TIM-barrel fold metal-dependent hydrolase